MKSKNCLTLNEILHPAKASFDLSIRYSDHKKFPHSVEQATHPKLKKINKQAKNKIKSIQRETLKS